MGITENIDGKKVVISGRVLTISNIISFSRVLIAFPIIYFHLNNNYAYNTEVIVLIVYAVISDYLDGLVARKTNSISEVGKMIDPISDKLCAGTLFIYTVWLGWVPLWFLIFFILRDTLILIGSSFIKLRYGKVAMSTMSGKISVNIISAYWLFVFFLRDAEIVHQFLLWFSVVIMIISFLDYFNRYRKIMRGAQFN